jgi:hypothetical protein
MHMQCMVCICMGKKQKESVLANKKRGGSGGGVHSIRHLPRRDDFSSHTHPHFLGFYAENTFLVFFSGEGGSIVCVLSGFRGSIDYKRIIKDDSMIIIHRQAGRTLRREVATLEPEKDALLEGRSVLLKRRETPPPLGRSVAFAGGWSGEAAGRREERGRKGQCFNGGIFFCGVVLCFALKPPSCWCFMFSLPLCAPCLIFPSLGDTSHRVRILHGEG